MLFCAVLTSQVSFLFASETTLGELSQSDIELANIDQCLGTNEHPNRIDLCILDKALTYMHPNVYFTIGKTTYSQRIKELNEIAPRLTNQQFYLYLAEFVAQLNDVHTYVDFKKIKHTTSQISFSLINNRVQLNNVVLNQQPRDSLTLLAVNEHDATDLVEQYSKYFANTNKQPDKNKATRNLLAIYSLLQPNKDINLKVKSVSGDILNLSINQANVKVEAKEQRLIDEGIQCQLDSYLFIEIKSFKSIESTTCLKYFQKFISNKKEQQHHSLVIDLRDNYGGDADVAREISNIIFGVDIFELEENIRLVTNTTKVRGALIELVLDKAIEKAVITQQQLNRLQQELSTYSPSRKKDTELSLIKSNVNNIKYIENTEEPSSPGYFLVEPEASSVATSKQILLPVYIIANENTGSAATLFALYAQKRLSAKLIGTGIGGDRNTFGSPLKITLPHSKIPIYIATAYLIKNHVVHYKDIQWPSSEDTPIILDLYLDSEYHETPMEIVKSLFTQPFSTDKPNTTQ